MTKAYNTSKRSHDLLKAILVALLAIAATLYSQPVLAQQIDCTMEAGLKAVRGQPHVVLSFRNSASQPYRLYWIDYEGHRKAYGGIAPGADRRQPSSVGNHWVVTDEADKCVAIFTASATANDFAIQNPGKSAVAPAPIAAAPVATPSTPAPVVAIPGPTPVPMAPVAIGPMITPDGFAKLFPPAGSPPAPTSTIVLTPQGPVMVTSAVPPPGSAAPTGPVITLATLNALLFPSDNPCGAPTSTTVLSPAGPRIVSALRAPRPGSCGIPVAPAATSAQSAPPAATDATPK